MRKRKHLKNSSVRLDRILNVLGSQYVIRLMHVRHAHVVKLFAQAELCVAKMANIYIGMHACMHGGLGNVGMHVWHVQSESA